MNERIRKIRKDAGLTQAEFAGRLGLQMNSVYLMESGRRNPSPAIAREICRKFSVNEQWLQTGEGEPYRDLSPAMLAADQVRQLMVDHPNSTAGAVISALLRLDPLGPEWDVIGAVLDLINENRK